MSLTKQANYFLGTIHDESKEIRDVAAEHTHVEGRRVGNGGELALEKDNIPGFSRHLDLGSQDN
jgi:hypothetical protein